MVDTLGIYDDPQLVAREFHRVVPNPKMKPYRQTGPTWRFLDAPPHEMRRSPWFGEHNGELLAEAGCTPAEIEELRAGRVVAEAPIDPGIG